MIFFASSRSSLNGLYSIDLHIYISTGYEIVNLLLRKKKRKFFTYRLEVSGR